MANEPVRCIQTIRHPKIKLSDPGTGKSALLGNPDKAPVRTIKMDHCLAPEGTVAADFVASKPDLVDVIVELKGRNVDHAAEQVDATWLFWSRHAEHTQGQLISAWILCKQFPQASQKAKRALENFRNRGGKLIISTHNGEERPFTDFVPSH